MNTVSRAFLTLIFLIIPTLSSAMPTWTEVASDDVLNIDELALVRDSSGVLHIIWRISISEGDKFRYRTLSADSATFSDTRTILDDWDSLSNPALRLKDDGTLQLVFTGLNGDINPTDGLYLLESTDSGANWTLDTTTLSDSRAGSQSIVSATPGTVDLYSTWSSTGGIYYHVGENSSSANEFTGDQDACCANNPNLAVDAVSGDVFLGWYSNATGDYGQKVQSVSPMASSATYIPQSARDDRTAALSINQRTPITGRLGASGVYVAYCTGYPTCDSVLLWRVGDSDPTTISDDSGSRNVNLIPGADGRLWAIWTNSTKVYATRSNTDVSTWGRIQSYELPADQTTYRLAGEASQGDLELFPLTGLSGVAHYHMNVKPGLTLRGAPRRVRAGRRVRFRVTDAGDPVQGALVKAFGRRARTRANGRAVIRVPSPVRKKKGVATKAGYGKSNNVKFTGR